jgi:hypothetical protein
MEEEQNKEREELAILKKKKKKLPHSKKCQETTARKLMITAKGTCGKRNSYNWTQCKTNHKWTQYKSYK